MIKTTPEKRTKKSNKEAKFKEDVEKVSLFEDLLEKYENGQFVELITKLNDYWHSFSCKTLKEAIEKAFYQNRYGANSTKINFYYNPYDRCFEIKSKPGLTAYRISINLHNLDWEGNETLADALSSYTKEAYFDILTEYNIRLLELTELDTWDFKVLPEDVPIKNVISGYNKSIENGNFMVRDFHFQQDTVDDISQYVFDKIKDDFSFEGLERFVPFLSKEDRAFIFTEVIAKNLNEAAQSLNYDWINDNKVFIIEALERLRVFSNKKVKVEFNNSLSQLIEAAKKDVRFSHFASKLNAGDYTSSTTFNPQNLIKKEEFDLVINSDGFNTLPEDEVSKKYGTSNVKSSTRINEFYKENASKFIFNDAVTLYNGISEFFVIMDDSRRNIQNWSLSTATNTIDYTTNSGGTVSFITYSFFYNIISRGNDVFLDRNIYAVMMNLINSRLELYKLSIGRECELNTSTLFKEFFEETFKELPEDYEIPECSSHWFLKIN